MERLPLSTQRSEASILNQCSQPVRLCGYICHKSERQTRACGDTGAAKTNDAIARHGRMTRHTPRTDRWQPAATNSSITRATHHETPLTPSHLIRSHLTPSDSMPSHPTLTHPIPPHPIPPHPAPSHPIPCGLWSCLLPHVFSLNILPGGAVLWEWDADADRGEAAGERWLILLPSKWNPSTHKQVYSWRYDPVEL